MSTTAGLGPAGINPGPAAPARIYDYLLGGSSYFPVDREAAERIMALVPEIQDCAWANRGFISGRRGG